MPLNEMSRAWGSLHSKELPVALRAPVYGTWGWFFGSRMEECGAPLSSYRNLSEFFTRSLKPGVRPVSSDHQIVSPVDGKVVNFGEVVGDKVEQIKGVTYTLQKFLGFDPYSRMSKDEKSGEKKLFFCTLYLAPGDYHRIHGSASWTVDECIHIPGRLFPVAPSVTSIVPELFATNERVVLAGKWSGGFYSLTSVGALNVGSIQLLDDVASAFVC